jgi:hypothetical protein
MSPLKFVLADIAWIEAGRDALSPDSHLAALFELPLDRLREEAAALRPVTLTKVA